MEIFEEKACLCALNRIFGFRPKAGIALLSHYGSAREVFSVGRKELDHVMGPFSKYREHICRKTVDDAAEELVSLSGRNITFCGITEDDYPPMLKDCEDPPVGLYVRSHTPVGELWKRDGISIVGTRDISPYGKEWCERIVRGLSATDSRPAIISGLAIGVDITAHRAALASGLPTIAVMATGPDDIYPYRHRESAEQMVETRGCALVTDFPPGTAPLATHFLRRNRIIAGLGRACLLIESKIRGGGLMTSDLAFSYNREVYALPGRADDIRSQGCNELIRRKTAEPITSVAQLAECLGMKYRSGGTSADVMQGIRERYSARYGEREIALILAFMKTIRQHRGITVEELADATETDFIKAAGITRMLESDGLITIDLLQRCCINIKNM